MRVVSSVKIKKVACLAIVGTILLIGSYSIVTNILPARDEILDEEIAGVGRAQFGDVQDALSSRPSVVIVDADGNFDDRVAQLNAELDVIRRRTWELRGSGDWRKPGPVQQALSGARDDYLDVLATNYPHVTTVVLPWKKSTGEGVWNSLADTENLPLQVYHEWTADDALCSWIETRGGTNMRYDAVFNRTCARNINETIIPSSLRPVFLNAKPVNPRTYWPNNGTAYPARLYTQPPPYVFYLHIHRDAIVTSFGDVYSGNLQLVLCGCSMEIDPIVPSVDQLYDEVFVIAQYWGTGVFHRMCEIVPRIALYREFLNRNPSIRIVAPELTGGRLSELLHIIGLDESRLIVGPVRAKVVYQPRSSPCGFANAIESQVLNRLYGDYIRKQFQTRERSRLLLVRRTGLRRFTEQTRIEEVLKRVAQDFNLNFALFVDNPTPSLNQTMIMFHSAVIVVAPHGAGLSNLFFSQPGTYVVEGVCNRPHVNVCFLWLAHVLGHHWHGVTSRGGCESVVDVSAASVEQAVITHLKLWRLAQS